MRLFLQSSKPLAAITLLLLLLSSGGSAIAQDPDFERLQAKRQELFSLFEQGDLDALDQELNAIQRRYESNELTEENLQEHFGWFRSRGSIDGKKFDAGLTTWVEQKPQSYAAHLMRGIFYVQRGFDSRGTKFSAETSGAQFREMRRWFKRGKKDLTASLAMTNKPLLSHSWLMSVALLSSNRAEHQAYFNEAINYAPRTYRIRSNFMHGLRPRWGGGYEKMEQFARESEAVFGPGEKADRLRNIILDDRARMLLDGEDFASASNLLSEGLANRESANLRCMRAHANVAQDRFDEAVSDLDASTTYAAPHRYCASMVSWFAEFSGQDPRVEALLNAYIARNPGDLTLYERRAMIRQSRGDHSGAFADFEIAALMGSVQAKARAGQYLLHGWGGVERDSERALLLLRDASETGDSFSRHILNEALKLLGRESEEIARKRQMQESKKRLRRMKTTWEMKQGNLHWGLGRIADHRVIASVLGALLMMMWVRRERRSIEHRQ